MPVRQYACAVLVSAALVFPSLSAEGENLPPPKAAYSATQTLRVDGELLTARIFHDGGKERREMKMQGIDSVMILRPADQKAYAIQPQINMAMELPLDGPDSVPDPTGLADLDAVAEGREIVAGQETTRYRINGSGRGQGFTGLVWATADGIYARMEGKVAGDGRSADLRMDLSDIIRGPQDSSLFMLPEGVRVMDMAPVAGRTPELLRSGKP